VKDQYVGDVSDYFKYALLRSWVARGLTIGLGWMLTEADGRADGGLLSYLQEPEFFRDLDPALYDGLAKLVSEGDRRVQAVVDRGLVAHAFSYSDHLTDAAPDRAKWWKGLEQRTHDADVLFLDPDNGLEVSSVTHGRAGARRYVYLGELKPLHRPDQSLAVYQHFPRVARSPYLEAQLERLATVWPTSTRFAVCSPRIAMLVCATAEAAEAMIGGARELVERASGGVGLWLHSSENSL
jgi:hypothetical protein